MGFYHFIKKNTLIAVVLCLVLAVIAMVAFLSHPKPLRWKSGDEQSYYFHLQSNSRTMDFGSGGSSVIRNDVDGLLQLRIMEVLSDKVIIGFRVQPDTVVINGVVHPRFSELYSSPFFVEMLHDGTILSIRIVGDINENDVQYINSLMYYLQYVQLSGWSWKSAETGPEGEFVSTYRSGFHRVMKKRKLMQMDQQKYLYAKKIVINKSQFSYTFDNDWSWISGLIADEKWRIIGDKLDSTTDVRVVLKKREKSISSDTKDQLAMSYIDRNNDNPKKRKESLFEELRLESVRNNIEEDEYNLLIKQLKAKSISSNDFVKRMRDYLKLYPGKSRDIAKLIKDRKVDDESANLIMFTMGEVGYSECQHALYSIISDDTVSDDNRLKSAVYIGNVKYPDFDVVREMQNFNFDYESNGSALYSSAIINSLGRMGSVDKKNAEVSEEITKMLKGFIYEDGSIQKKISTLYAIGNTKSDAFIPEIQTLKASDSSLVRSTVAEALETIPGDAANEILIDMMHNDKDPFVRERAVVSQLSRDYDETVTSTILSDYSTESETIVRKAMVDYLVKFSDKDSTILSQLKKMLETETSREVREKILQAIHSEKN